MSPASFREYSTSPSENTFFKRKKNGMKSSNRIKLEIKCGCSEALSKKRQLNSACRQTGCEQRWEGAVIYLYCCLINIRNIDNSFVLPLNSHFLWVSGGNYLIAKCNTQLVLLLDTLLCSPAWVGSE